MSDKALILMAIFALLVLMNIPAFIILGIGVLLGLFLKLNLKKWW